MVLFELVAPNIASTLSAATGEIHVSFNLYVLLMYLVKKVSIFLKSCFFQLPLGTEEQVCSE